MQYPRVKLGDAFETSAGGTPLKSHNEYYDNGTIPWLRSGEVCQKNITSTELFITKDGLNNSSAKLFPINTVLVAMYGATAGQVGILRIEAATNQAVCGILPGNYIPEYLYYQLLYLKDFLVSQAVGGAQPNVSQEKIKNLEIQFPPLPIQQEIVAHLEKELAKVDEMAESFKRMAGLADEEFRAVLSETFEHVEGKKVKLGEIGNIVTGCTPSKSCSAYYGHDYPFFKPTDLNQGFNVSLASEFLSVQGWNISRQLPINSVLVTCIGTLGKVGIIRKEGSCNQQINAIIPKLLPPEYVYFWILSPSFQSKLWYMSNATTLPIVSKSQFSKFEIIIPQKNTSKIVEFLIEEKNKKEDFISESQKGLALCTELRKSILQEAFA